MTLLSTGAQVCRLGVAPGQSRYTHRVTANLRSFRLRRCRELPYLEVRHATQQVHCIACLWRSVTRIKGMAMSTRARPVATALTTDPPPAVAHCFPGDRRCPGRARRALRRQLQVWGVSGEPGDCAELLLSELVTNAVQAQAAGGSDIGVRFVWAGGRLRLEVWDASDELPVRNEAEEDDECGRGLMLVDALGSGWGVVRDVIGKTVWAEVVVGDASAPCLTPAWGTS
ncbi:ATP-binding protein [Streptomyces kronopolitis]|uniref:ATP-binding protein n=1 Tax=Streptomyces kronopolitis TaxID=1612435 RepID=UPI0036D19161